MRSQETPLHRVRGLGAAHSGTGHFWRMRVTSVALIPLSLWFAFSVLGLAGGTEVSALRYLSHPWNAILMALFAVILLYHTSLGLQDIVDDYVHSAGMKIFCLLLIRFGVIATGSACLFALSRIATV